VLEEVDLTYDGVDDVSTIDTKITIPIKAEIIVKSYKDRETGKVSAAKVLEIEYDEKAITQAADDQIVVAVKKAVPGEDFPKPKNGWGSHRQVGFVNSISNKQYQKDSEWQS